MPAHINKRKDKSSTPEYLEGWERTFGGNKNAYSKHKTEPQAGSKKDRRLPSGPTTFGEDPRNKLSWS